MPVTTLVQALALALGLAAGALWPRQAGGVLVTDSVISVVTGTLLFSLRLGFTFCLTWWGVKAVDIGLIDLTPLPDALQFLVAFLALDFVRYWVHLADHRVPILWRFHRVHHSTERIDATSGLRMHAIDFLQLSAIPLFLFGVLFHVNDGWPLMAALSVGIVADSIEHANVRFPLDTRWRRVWFRVFNTPLFHSWHHTRDGSLCDGNYANALPLWDRLFGTEVTRPDPPELYGVGGDQALDNSILGLQALRPRRAE